MKVTFGFYTHRLLPKREEAQAYLDLVRMAEDYGVEAIGTGDSSFTMGDACVPVTMMAMASERARIGLRPTNPITREPQVMASFLASIDSLTNGRAFMDIGTGDSSVYNIGRKPATRAELEEYITCVRQLLATGESTYEGRSQGARWSAAAVRSRIPIWLCAEGPRMLHLAGRIGDGVTAGTGLTAEVISDTIRRVEAGAAGAGRAPSEVEIWFTTRTALHEEREQALDEVRGSVSSILNHAMRFGGFAEKLVPEHLRVPLQEYVDGYAVHDHGLQAGNNPKRMEALGLTDYAMQRWALAGNPSDWVRRIEEIAAAGATRLWVGVGRPPVAEQQHILRLLGEKVMPHFR